MPMSNNHQLAGLVPIPGILEGAAAFMRLHRLGGEWDLQHPAGIRIVEAWNVFATAFPWAHVRTLSFASADGKSEWRREESTESSTDWLQRVVERSPEGFGFEAALDLELVWVDVGGRLARSLFPDSAYTFLDAVDSFQTLAIWPNLFTDEIRVYAAIPGDEGRFEGSPFAFQPAAAANRAMLE